MVQLCCTIKNLGFTAITNKTNIRKLSKVLLCNTFESFLGLGLSAKHCTKDLMKAHQCWTFVKSDFFY
jgi:hypothetical protein